MLISCFKRYNSLKKKAPQQILVINGTQNQIRKQFVNLVVNDMIVTWNKCCGALILYYKFVIFYFFRPLINLQVYNALTRLGDNLGFPELKFLMFFVTAIF